MRGVSIGVKGYDRGTIGGRDRQRRTFQDSPSYGFIQGVEVWRTADPAAAGGSMAPAPFLLLAPASGGATSTAGAVITVQEKQPKNKQKRGTSCCVRARIMRGEKT